LPKFKIGTSHFGNIFEIWIGVQEEETFEKIKMRINSKESFAQMDKNCDIKDGIRG